MISMHGQGRVISNFALLHFLGAKHFAGVVDELEVKHAGQPLGAFSEEICIYCSSCIVSAAASLEALINELYLDPSGPLHQAVDDFDSFFWGGERKKCCWLWSRSAVGLERKPALEKYRKASKLLGQSPLTRDHPTYKNAECLVAFRNYLIHFKPLWDEERRDDDLEQSLHCLFPTSSHVDAGADFLATRCMSGGCAKWAVSSVIEFVHDFAQRSNLDPKKLAAFR